MKLKSKVTMCCWKAIEGGSTISKLFRPWSFEDSKHNSTPYNFDDEDHHISKKGNPRQQMNLFSCWYTFKSTWTLTNTCYNFKLDFVFFCLYMRSIARKSEHTDLILKDYYNKLSFTIKQSSLRFQTQTTFEWDLNLKWRILNSDGDSDSVLDSNSRQKYC